MLSLSLFADAVDFHGTTKLYNVFVCTFVTRSSDSRRINEPVQVILGVDT